jgi:catechol 2,3-dioxygenase-like lactoylglutathione lyase family enzyme
MLDHIGLAVSDVARSKTFFTQALAPLGISAMVSVTPEESGGGAHIGFGSNDRAYFWIADAKAPTSGVHVAFTATDRATVDAFYAAALAAGGRDNGPPGVRAYYHPDYYGAFILDFDDHNIEAVCHAPA